MLDAAQNPRGHRMESKSREGQPADQVGPVVPAGDMSQFVKQDVIELRPGNLLLEEVRENDNGVQEAGREG